MADKDALLANRVTGRTAVVTIDGVGDITVRGLSRAELLEDKYGNDDTKKERWILSRAVIDPPLTEADVATWQANSPPDEINQVAQKINEISGIAQGAQKRGVPESGD